MPHVRCRTWPPRGGIRERTRAPSAMARASSLCGPVIAGRALCARCGNGRGDGLVFLDIPTGGDPGRSSKGRQHRGEATVMRRLAVLTAIVSMLAFAGIMAMSAPAGAYGNTALWQIGISGNCDNPAVCGADQLGGFWGWVEFDSGNTGDATIAGCAHLQGRQLPGSSGAAGERIDITGWTIAPGSAGPDTFFVTSEVDTFYSRGGPVTVTIASENFDTGIPAVPGHYSTADVLGFTAPGVSFQIQVAQLTH